METEFLDPQRLDTYFCLSFLVSIMHKNNFQAYIFPQQNWNLIVA